MPHDREPRILITVQGGVIQSIDADAGVQVAVIDFDLKETGADPLHDYALDSDTPQGYEQAVLHALAEQAGWLERAAETANSENWTAEKCAAWLDSEGVDYPQNADLALLRSLVQDYGERGWD